MNTIERYRRERDEQYRRRLEVEEELARVERELREARSQIAHKNALLKTIKSIVATGRTADVEAIYDLCRSALPPTENGTDAAHGKGEA